MSTVKFCDYLMCSEQSLDEESHRCCSREGFRKLRCCHSENAEFLPTSDTPSFVTRGIGVTSSGPKVPKECCTRYRTSLKGRESGYCTSLCIYIRRITR